MNSEEIILNVPEQKKENEQWMSMSRHEQCRPSRHEHKEIILNASEQKIKMNGKSHGHVMNWVGRRVMKSARALSALEKKTLIYYDLI
jgi:hypothetical protein